MVQPVNLAFVSKRVKALNSFLNLAQASSKSFPALRNDGHFQGSTHAEHNEFEGHATPRLLTNTAVRCVSPETSRTRCHALPGATDPPLAHMPNGAAELPAPLTLHADNCHTNFIFLNFKTQQIRMHNWRL